MFFAFAITHHLNIFVDCVTGFLKKCLSKWDSFISVSNEKWHSSHSISHVQWDSLDFFILILGQAGLWSSHAPRPSFKRIPAADQVSVEQFRGLFDIKSKGPEPSPHTNPLFHTANIWSRYSPLTVEFQKFLGKYRISKVSSQSLVSEEFEAKICWRLQLS